MTIHIYKAHLDTFRRKARKTKKEIFALLIGTLDGDDIYVSYFDYTKIDNSDTTSVTPDLSDVSLAYEMAEGAGMSRVGTIHSHPGAPAYMSPSDLRSHKEDGDLISGIVEVCGGKTRVAFWQDNTSVPCYVHTYSKRKK